VLEQINREVVLPGHMALAALSFPPSNVSWPDLDEVFPPTNSRKPDAACLLHSLHRGRLLIACTPACEIIISFSAEQLEWDWPPMTPTDPDDPLRTAPPGAAPPSARAAWVSTDACRESDSPSPFGQPTSPFEPDQTVPPSGKSSETAAQPLPAFAGYEILSVLGRGGMGVVYQARDLQLKRLVALKVILAGSHAGAHELARFKAEAEAIARLQHPNIVQIHEVGEHDGKPFISLEFCAGGSLDGKLDGTPLPPSQAAAVGADAGAGDARGPCGAGHPSRSQAGQCPAHARRHAQDHGFWLGEEAR